MSVAKNGAQNCFCVSSRNVMVSFCLQFLPRVFHIWHQEPVVNKRCGMEYRAMGESELSVQVMLKKVKNRIEGDFCKLWTSPPSSRLSAIHTLHKLAWKRNYNIISYFHNDSFKIHGIIIQCVSSYTNFNDNLLL